jgi:EmrB/QacA subfamily drug resistance transporter
MAIAEAPDDVGLERGTVVALGAMALGIFLVANDFTALSVALPDIEQEFDADVSAVQWVINGYALVFGVLIVTGGRLCDMYGRRRLFFWGAGIFTVFSAVSALAPSLAVLLAARAAMGVGGAVMWPAVLGMTFAALPARQAGLAGGLVLGVAGLGNAVGPFLGGMLTQTLSWRWVFVVNVPVAVIAVLATWRYIHQPFTRDARDRLDILGVIALSVALVSLLVAFDEVSELGWGDGLVLALLGVFAVSTVLFVLAERHAGRNALIPGDVIGRRQFGAACVAVSCTAGVFFVALLYLPQLFQKVFDQSPLQAGLALLPLMGTFTIVSFVAGTLYAHLGAKLIVTTGAALITAGILLLSFVPDDVTYLDTLPGMFVLGLGVGLFISTITTAAVTSLDESRTSLGGAVLYMFQVAAGAVGLALTTAIFSSAAADQVQRDVATLGLQPSDQQVEDVQGILAGTKSATEVLAQLPADATRIIGVVRDAFVDAFQLVARVNAAISVVAIVVSVGFIGRWRRNGDAPSP